MASIDSSDEEGEAYPSWLFSRPKKASNAGLPSAVQKSSGDSLAVSKKRNNGNSKTETPAVVPKGLPAKRHKENTGVVQKKSRLSLTKQNHNETLQLKTLDKVAPRGGRASTQVSLATEQVCDENLLVDTTGQVVPQVQKSRSTFTKQSYNETLLLETIDEVARGGQTLMQTSVSAKQICEKNLLVKTIDEDLIVGCRKSKLKVKRPASYFSLIAHRNDSSSSSDSENDSDAEDKCEPQELDLQDGSDTDKYEFEFDENSNDSAKEMQKADSVLLISEKSSKCSFSAKDSSSDDGILPAKITKTNQKSVQLKPNFLSIKNMLPEPQVDSILRTSRYDLAPPIPVERNSFSVSNDGPSTNDLLNLQNSTVGTSSSPCASQLIMPFDETDSQMRIKLICMELGKNPYNYDMPQPKNYQSNPASGSKPTSKNITSSIAGLPQFATGVPPRNRITNKSSVSASSSSVSAVGVGFFDEFSCVDIAERQPPTVSKPTVPQNLSSEFSDSSSDLDDFISAISKRKLSDEVNKPVPNLDYDSEATIAYEEYSQNKSHDAQDTSVVNLSTPEQLGYSSALLNVEANNRSELNLVGDSDPEEDEKNLSQLLASERDIDEQFGCSILDSTDYGISEYENNQSLSQLMDTEQKIDDEFGYSIPKTVDVSSVKPSSMTTDFNDEENQQNVADLPATSTNLLSILHNFFANRGEFPAKNATICTDSNVDISLVPRNLGKSSSLETDLSKIVGDFFINFNVTLSMTAPSNKDIDLLESLLRVLPTAAKPVDPNDGQVPSTSRQSSSFCVNTAAKSLNANDGQVPSTSRQSSSSFVNTVAKPLNANDGQVPSTSQQSSSFCVNTAAKSLNANDGQVPSTSRQSSSFCVNTAAKSLNVNDGQVPSTSRQSSSFCVNTAAKPLDPNDGQVPSTSRQSSSSFVNTVAKPLDPNDGQVPSTSRQSSSSFVNAVDQSLDSNDGQVPQDIARVCYGPHLYQNTNMIPGFSTAVETDSSDDDFVSKPMTRLCVCHFTNNQATFGKYLPFFSSTLGRGCMLRKPVKFCSCKTVNKRNTGISLVRNIVTMEKIELVSTPFRETIPLEMKVEGAETLEKDKPKEIFKEMDIYLKRKKLLDSLEESAKRLKKETTYNKEEMSKISFTLFSESTVLSDCSLSDEDISILIEPKMDLIPNEIETISIPSSPESGGTSVAASRSFTDLCTPIVTLNVPKFTRSTRRGVLASKIKMESKPSKKVKKKMNDGDVQAVLMDGSVVNLIPNDEDYVSLKRKRALENLSCYNQNSSSVFLSKDKSSFSNSLADLSGTSPAVDEDDFQPYCVTVNKENRNVSTVTSETLSKEGGKATVKHGGKDIAGSTFTTENLDKVIENHLNASDFLQFQRPFFPHLVDTQTAVSQFHRTRDDPCTSGISKQHHKKQEANTYNESVGVGMRANLRKRAGKNETCTSGALESSGFINNMTATNKPMGVRMHADSQKRLAKNETCTSGALKSSGSINNMTATNKPMGVRLPADSRKRLAKNETCTSSALESSGSVNNMTATNKPMGVRLPADSRKRLAKNETCTSSALESSGSVNNMTATNKPMGVGMHAVPRKRAGKIETCTSVALESSEPNNNLTATNSTHSLKTNVSTVCTFPIDKNETCTNRNDKVSHDYDVSTSTELIVSSTSSVPTGSANRSEVYAGWKSGEELGRCSTPERSCKLQLCGSESSTIPVPEMPVLGVELQPDCSNSAVEECDPNSTMFNDGCDSDSYMDMDVCSPAVPDIIEPEVIPPVVQPLVEVDDGLVIWECPICFEPKTRTTKLATTKCGHLFCESCVRQVVAVHKKCPVCQQELANDGIIAMAFHGYKF